MIAWLLTAGGIETSAVDPASRGDGNHYFMIAQLLPAEEVATLFYKISLVLPAEGMAIIIL